MAAAAPDPNTVRSGLTICGVDNIVMFHGETQAQRLAQGIFMNDFTTCLDKNQQELKDDLKSYSELRAGHGQIRLTPAVKKHIQAFIQWVKDCLRK